MTVDTFGDLMIFYAGSLCCIELTHVSSAFVAVSSVWCDGSGHGANSGASSLLAT